jgi:hypothetical protein
MKLGELHEQIRIYLKDRINEYEVNNDKNMRGLCRSINEFKKVY